MNLFNDNVSVDFKPSAHFCIAPAGDDDHPSFPTREGVDVLVLPGHPKFDPLFMAPVTRTVSPGQTQVVRGPLKINLYEMFYLPKSYASKIFPRAITIDLPRMPEAPGYTVSERIKLMEQVSTSSNGRYVMVMVVLGFARTHRHGCCIAQDNHQEYYCIVVDRIRERYSIHAASEVNSATRGAFLPLEANYRLADYVHTLQHWCGTVISDDASQLFVWMFEPISEDVVFYKMAFYPNSKWEKTKSSHHCPTPWNTRDPTVMREVFRVKHIGEHVPFVSVYNNTDVIIAGERIVLLCLENPALLLEKDFSLPEGASYNKTKHLMAINTETRKLYWAPLSWELSTFAKHLQQLENYDQQYIQPPNLLSAFTMEANFCNDNGDLTFALLPDVRCGEGEKVGVIAHYEHLFLRNIIFIKDKLFFVHMVSENEPLVDIVPTTDQEMRPNYKVTPAKEDIWWVCYGLVKAKASMYVPTTPSYAPPSSPEPTPSTSVGVQTNSECENKKRKLNVIEVDIE